MKKSRGFTLIELLAVIVILAVIALIAVPIILNVIDTSKKGALKDSAYGIIESADLYLAKNMGQMTETTEFECEKNICKEITCETINEVRTCSEVTDGNTINYKGSIDSGKLKLFSDGKVSICINKDNIAASKAAQEKEVKISDGSCNDDYTVSELISKKEYERLEKELTDLKSQGDATSEHILSGKKAIVKGVEVTGEMTNNGAINATINPGEIYTIPMGYHNGSGKVTVTASIQQSKISIGGAGTYNIDNYNSDCHNLTVNNFIWTITNGSTNDGCHKVGEATWTRTVYQAPSVSYNSSTCTLTASNGKYGFRVSGDGSSNSVTCYNTLNVDVYLVL